MANNAISTRAWAQRRPPTLEPENWHPEEQEGEEEDAFHQGENPSWHTLRPTDVDSASLTAEDLGALTKGGRDRQRQNDHLRMLRSLNTLQWGDDFKRFYTVEDMLGHGGSGMVFIGKQRNLSRPVAIKVGGLKGARQMRQFRSEALITAALEHPNIIPVYDAGDSYLVMQRIEGINLLQRIRRQWPEVDHPEMVEILIQVSNAVAFAHDRGVVHRDIKAANIMLGRYGQVLLLDWGLANTWSGSPRGELPGAWKPEDTTMAGTPACLPPEVAHGRDRSVITPAMDVFCLGAVLYHVLTGLMPFTSSSVVESIALAADNRYQPVERLNPKAPAGLVRLQETAMASDPAERPTVEAFRDGLRSWLYRSGNETEAREAWREARRLVERARKYERHAWEPAFRDFIDAIALFDRARNLCPEMEKLGRERKLAMREFSRRALKAGSIQLARLLSRGISFPVADAAEAGRS